MYSRLLRKIGIVPAIAAYGTLLIIIITIIVYEYIIYIYIRISVQMCRDRWFSGRLLLTAAFCTNNMEMEMGYFQRNRCIYANR